MQERWQAFQLGWELVQHLVAPSADLIFNPLLGSIYARLKLFGLELDFARLDYLRARPGPEIAARIPELKQFLPTSYPRSPALPR